MSRVFRVDPADPSGAAEALQAATDAIGAGLLVVIPTETVYGIACRPDDPQATRRLFYAKRRPTGLNLPVLCPTEEAAWEIAVPNDAARRLARAFWPGPLTMVLGRSEQSIPWELGDSGETIGVRVPDHLVAAALLRYTGPLAVTSANKSGERAIDDPDLIPRAFDSLVSVYLLSEKAPPRPGVPSTVVEMVAPGLRIIRQGALDADRLLEAVEERDGDR